VPAAVYHELADTGSADCRRIRTDTAIEEVASQSHHRQVIAQRGSIVALDQLRKHGSLQMSFNQQSKYPETNNWQDAALVALAVRLFG